MNGVKLSTFSMENERPLVVLAHAYSPANSGDGLLVELACKVVLRAVPNALIVTVALNAAAFGDEGYVQWGAWENDSIPTRINLLATTFTGGSGRVRALFDEADLIVAVGGGYMRGNNFPEAVKSWNAHFAQLKLIARYGEKAIYLPQSIGPFLPVYADLVRKRLAAIGALYLRDDRSMREFGAAPNARRMPDLSVLELAESWDSNRPPLSPDRRPVIVARKLDRARNYPVFLREVANSGQFEWAIQSLGRGNNDLPITSRYSPKAPRALKIILAEGEPRIVVSTRLHGSMAALLAGHPTIHLSYERKGWGAFEDLGISKYVLNARDVTLAEVQDLIHTIEAEPPAYWQAIEERQQGLNAQGLSMKRNIREILNGLRA